jgi:hypothetical protein
MRTSWNFGQRKWIPYPNLTPPPVFLLTSSHVYHGVRVFPSSPRVVSHQSSTQWYVFSRSCLLPVDLSRVSMFCDPIHWIPWKHHPWSMYTSSNQCVSVCVCVCVTDLTLRLVALCGPLYQLACHGVREDRGDGKQCVKQTFRVRCPPLNLGGGWGRLTVRVLAAQSNFFFELLSSDQFSYRICCLGQIMYTFRVFFFLGKKPKQEGSWKRGYKFRTVLKGESVGCNNTWKHHWWKGKHPRIKTKQPRFVCLKTCRRW